MLIVRLTGFVCGVMIWLSVWGCVRTSNDALYVTQSDNGFYKLSVTGHRGGPVSLFVEYLVLAELQIGKASAARTSNQTTPIATPVNDGPGRTTQRWRGSSSRASGPMERDDVWPLAVFLAQMRNGPFGYFDRLARGPDSFTRNLYARVTHFQTHAVMLESCKDGVLPRFRPALSQRGSSVL